MPLLEQRTAHSMISKEVWQQLQRIAVHSGRAADYLVGRFLGPLALHAIRLLEWFCGLAFSVAVLAWVNGFTDSNISPLEAAQVPVLLLLVYGALFLGARRARHVIKDSYAPKHRIPKGLSKPTEQDVKRSACLSQNAHGGNKALTRGNSIDD